MTSDTIPHEPAQTVKADPMSVATQRPADELKPAVPTFSYAQAAKGKTPSSGTALVEQSSSENQKVNKSQNGHSATESKDVLAQSITNEDKIQSSDISNSNVDPVSESKEGSGHLEEIPASADTQGNISKQGEGASREPSPNYGTTSVSTLHKDDDGFSNLNSNGSSDSTWDKQSQSSHNGSKVEDKSITTKDGTQVAPNSTWDEEKTTPPVAFKEAPPPSVNFWAQRMAQNPKPKSQQTGSNQNTKVSSLGMTSTASDDQTKPVDNASETRKPDNKRKPTSQEEDRPSIRDEARSSENKAMAPEVARNSEATPVCPLPPPPPPGDAVSWPTPDTAVEEEKRKHNDRVDRVDRDKVPIAKSHGKKEWQHVPFVPTVNFNTPLPTARREGRGGRSAGTRGEGAARGRNMNGIDKSASMSFNPNMTSSASDERGRAPVNSSGSASNGSKPKRASSAGPSIIKEMRKPQDSGVAERNKDASVSQRRTSQGKEGRVGEARRLSANAPVENLAHRNSSGRTVNKDNANGKRSHGYSGDEHSLASVAAMTTPNGLEGTVRGQESWKDSQTSFLARERGESRSDRGRGGYRGRGVPNHANGFPANGHSFSNAYGSQYPSMTPSSSSKSFSNHERSSAPGQGSSYYSHTSMPGTSQNRSHRANSRSQSYQHPHGRFPNGAHPGAPQLAHLQTDLANFYGMQPEPQGSMSAIPFNPYTMPQTNLFGMVTVQIEYYFSVDNLCKDTFLRSHMDSQGFVPLSLVAGFRRIQQLTPDLELIKYVCMMSHIIESRQAEDGVDWVRRRDDWKQWIMNYEDRVPSAQNDGPALISVAPYHSAEMFGPMQFADDRQRTSPRSDATIAPTDAMQYQSLESIAPAAGQMVTLPQQPLNGSNPPTRTPLSAAVSEFSPSVRSGSNRAYASPEMRGQGTNMISDEEMDKLCITFRTKPSDVSAPALPPFHSTSSRTFSNGSIDGATISNELHKFVERQPRNTLNGDTSDSVSTNKITRSRSPYSVGSPKRNIAPTSPPVLWFKDKDNSTRANSIPTEYTHASYPAFRQKALSQRETFPTGPCVYDMQVLYSFWAHYLIRNYNPSTYEHFKALAIEDEAQRKSSFGLDSLIQYYDEALLGQRTVPGDNIVSDFIDLVKKESSLPERPLFKKLRAAWRNGAFSHKNRSKIVRIIDADLKDELDK